MIRFTNASTRLLLWGIVSHLFFDWIMQNDAIARHKSDLRHPLAWGHSGLHLAGLCFVFPPYAACLIALSHLLIDTRKPLAWWRKFYRQTDTGDIALHVALWSDQCLHIVVLAIAAFIVGRRKAVQS